MHVEPSRSPVLNNLMDEYGQISVALAKHELYLVVENIFDRTPIKVESIITSSRGVSAVPAVTPSFLAQWRWTAYNQISLRDYNKCMTVRGNDLVLGTCETKRKKIQKTQKASYKDGWLKIASKCVQVKKSKKSFQVVLRSCSYSFFGL